MIKAGFVLLTVVMALAAYMVLNYASRRVYSDEKTQKHFLVRMMLPLGLWLIFVTAISMTGVFTVITLPPRIPLLLVAPTFVFMIYFCSSRKFRPLINAMPASWLVYLQSFRIVVELLLWGLFLQGVLPKSVTFEGYNYEIVIGITALLVGFLGYTRNVFPKPVILLWHLAGLTTLAIIVFLIISHAYFPSHWPDSAQFSMEAFGSFPYTLLPGFLMPLAVFMHVLSIMKLQKPNG